MHSARALLARLLALVTCAAAAWTCPGAAPPGPSLVAAVAPSHEVAVAEIRAMHSACRAGALERAIFWRERNDLLERIVATAGDDGSRCAFCLESISEDRGRAAKQSQKVPLIVNLFSISTRALIFENFSPGARGDDRGVSACVLRVEAY